jgi:hypothetical protein
MQGGVCSHVSERVVVSNEYHIEIFDKSPWIMVVVAGLKEKC